MISYLFSLVSLPHEVNFDEYFIDTFAKVHALFVPLAIRTLDYSYHRWTIRTLDCSYPQGPFVPSLD